MVEKEKPVVVEKEVVREVVVEKPVVVEKVVTVEKVVEVPSRRFEWPEEHHLRHRLGAVRPAG